MPTNRKRIARGRRGPPIDPDQWAVLNDQEPINKFVRLIKREQMWQDLWRQHRDAILADWVAKNPGTRPSFWWKFDMPVELFPSDDGQAGEPWPVPMARLQVGGTPVEPDAAYCATNFGIPAVDLDKDDPNYPADPPAWESQAAYLQRHDLLFPGEAKLLKQLCRQAKHSRQPAGKRS